MGHIQKHKCKEYYGTDEKGKFKEYSGKERIVMHMIEIKYNYSVHILPIQVIQALLFK